LGILYCRKGKRFLDGSPLKEKEPLYATGNKYFLDDG
jgi:hypothetical protein